MSALTMHFSSKQLGLRLRDRGEADAIKHATQVVPSALSALRDQIQWLAESGQPFTVESVMRRLSPALQECIARAPNCVGAEFSQAAQAGLIRRTGVTEMSSKPSARGRRICLWVGKDSVYGRESQR